MAIKFDPKKNLEYTLEVGDFLNFPTGRFFSSFYNLAYAGMVSKEFFSIIHDQDSNAKNLFYPISTKEIKTYEENKFDILEVNPEKIKLRYSGKY